MIIGELSGYWIVYVYKGFINYIVKFIGKNVYSLMLEFGVNVIDNLLLFYNEVEKFVKLIDVINEILGDFIYNVIVIDGGN